VVASELLFENKQVIDVVEDSVEIGCEQAWLNDLSHLFVAIVIDFELLFLVQREQFICVFLLEDFLYMVNLSKHGKVGV
jgi:hypothetical protein